MESDSHVVVRKIMMDFVRTTGLSPISRTPQRYLWTDAFAVCNLLDLYKRTGESLFIDLASALVDQVHHVLGQHRGDDGRTGWLSNLDDEHGRLHPTVGGLRIGKKLKERKPGDAFDDRLEWDRDGQYYHYLTKWMHALNRVAQVTGDFTFNNWAIELAKTAHSRFVYTVAGRRPQRMYWKMSIDLSRPLVTSMGHHDPLDGLVTYCELQSTASGNPGASTGTLIDEIKDMADVCKGMRWETDDPLGIGGLLTDAHRVAQIIVKQKSEFSQFFNSTNSVIALLRAAAAGLEAFAGQTTLQLPAEFRLAFRELGLSIGLQSVERLKILVDRNPVAFDKENSLSEALAAFAPYVQLVQVINRFWLNPESQKAESWMDHRDINTVMLATSLTPEGYLTIER